VLMVSATSNLQDRALVFWVVAGRVVIAACLRFSSNGAGGVWGVWYPCTDVASFE
jgi:hypothetical protein